MNNNVTRSRNETGFRSLRLGAGCTLRMCYDEADFGIQTCFTHSNNYSYKYEKLMPPFAACQCHALSRQILKPRELPVRTINQTIPIPFGSLTQATVRFRLKLAAHLYERASANQSSRLVIQLNDELAFYAFANRVNVSSWKRSEAIRQTQHTQSSLLNYHDFWISWSCSGSGEKASSFVKIGRGSTKEANMLLLSEPLDKTVIESLVSRNNLGVRVFLDDMPIVVSSASIELAAFHGDPAPFLTSPGEATMSLSPQSRFKPVNELPVAVQRLYAELNRWSVNILTNPGDIDAIGRSLDTPGCFLHSRRARSPLSILLFNDETTGMLVVLDIWPAKAQRRKSSVSSSSSFSSFSSLQPESVVQVCRILYGSLVVHHTEQLARQGFTTWSTPHYFSKLTALNNATSSITLTLRLIFDNNVSHYEQLGYEQLMRVLRGEHSQAHKCSSANTEEHECACFFVGTRCGQSLLFEPSAASSLVGTCVSARIEANSLYECGADTQRLRLVERCDRANATRCVNDERCADDPRRRRRAMLELVAAGKSSRTVRGRLVFEQLDDDRVRISGRIKGLKANAVHALHIHEDGNELGNMCQDTGPHFNPLLMPHGAPYDSLTERHLGDLGNVLANRHGHVVLNLTETATFNIQPDNYLSALYRSIVLHLRHDDLGRGNNTLSRYKGNSGPPIACGTILPI